MALKITSEIESLNIKKINGIENIILPALNKKQKDIINPLVPPTSGIRMIIYDEIEAKGKNVKKIEEEEKVLLMPAKKQYMFLRVFKAVSQIAKKEINKDNPGVLLVSDDRPSANHLVEYCAKILAFDNYKLFFQKITDPYSKKLAKKEPFYSRMGTPHGSASVELFDEIDLVIVLTASHNELIWNGIKFYINLPMPISGRVMNAVSEYAIKLEKIQLKSDFSVKYIDANKKNNDYIIKLVENILDLTVLKNKKIVIWPYMGRAPELVDLFERLGVEIVLIDEQMEPPNPTEIINHKKIEKTMNESGAKIAILLDTDRDRVVLVIRNPKTQKFQTYLPNSIYTAMHNLLSKKFDKKIINVRTIPSDPRCDNNSLLNIYTGVGFKHLGMILYGTLGYKLDPLKFKTGIFYVNTPQGNKKIETPEQIQNIFRKYKIKGKNILMALWEESGGHTINILNVDENKKGKIRITSTLHPIGDKYPAEALLILCSLIEMGYDLNEAIDQNILGTRAMIKADDEKKVKIVQKFAEMEGKIFKVGGIEYSVKNFERVDGKIAIIHLHTKTTNVFFRPSGTGPGVRIYIFGPIKTAEEQLKKLKEKIDLIFKN